MVATPALAGRNIYFGEDPGTGNDGERLENHPNADAARAAFLQALVTWYSDDLEAYAPGQGAPLTLEFDPSINAELTGRGIVWEVVEGTYRGTFPISGDQYWLVDNPTGPYTIAFGEAQVAFGFYATDVGDFGGQIEIAFDDEPGMLVPATVGGPSGGVIFFGVVRSDEPFTTVTLHHTVSVDGVGYDDFIIGPEDVPTVTELKTWGIMRALFRDDSGIVGEE